MGGESAIAGRREILLAVMQETATSQSEAARISGVRQPSISQVLTGRTQLSDDQLDHLLCCKGYQLVVTRSAAKPVLPASELRIWGLHREIAKHPTLDTFQAWLPAILQGLQDLHECVTAGTHLGNVAPWRDLVAKADPSSVHRVLTGHDRDSIGMREVSPMGAALGNVHQLSTVNAARL